MSGTYEKVGGWVVGRVWMTSPQRLNNDEGHIVPRRPMTMTDYTQLFFVLYWLWMKLYGFANFVEQHVVSSEYTGISYVVWLLYIEAFMWLI